jgi:hypothetical protein
MSVMVMRSDSAAWLAGAAAMAACGGALAACGSDACADPRPATAADYRALSDAARVAASAGCRDRVSDRSEGVAARQISDVDEALLRRRLDLVIADLRGSHPFDRACAATLPLVTPGLRVTFSGVTGNGITFTYPTRSDRPLTIRGTIAPVPAEGRVIARRESGPEQRIAAPIDERGQFVFRDLRLRKIADNTFLLTIDAPPNAPRLVRFSALCLDCIVSGSPAEPS